MFALDLIFNLVLRIVHLLAFKENPEENRYLLRKNPVFNGGLALYIDIRDCR